MWVSCPSRQCTPSLHCPLAWQLLSEYLLAWQERIWEDCYRLLAAPSLLLQWAWRVLLGQGLLSHDCTQEPWRLYLQFHHCLPHSIRLVLDWRLLKACCYSSSADDGNAVEACLRGLVGPEHVCLCSCAVAVVQCYWQVQCYQNAFGTRMSGGSQVTVVAAAAAAGDVLCPLTPSLQSIAQKKLVPNSPHITTAESVHHCH